MRAKRKREYADKRIKKSRQVLPEAKELPIKTKGVYAHYYFDIPMQHTYDIIVFVGHNLNDKEIVERLLTRQPELAKFKRK